MTNQEMLAEIVLSSKALLTRFLDGFDDSNRAAQAPNLPNSAIWCLGHTALTLNRVAERLDGRPLPESDFVTDATAEGKFGTESVAFNSKPNDDPQRYPSLARGIAIYESACDRLAAGVRAADDAALGRQIEWSDTQIPLWLLVARVVIHSGTHAGQITDLRRALGLERVLG